MRNTIIFIFLFSVLLSQSSPKNSLFQNNLYKINGGIFANYGTNNFEIDGFFDMHLNNGYFFESNIFSQLDSNIIFNNALGRILEIKSDILVAFGYSNYIEMNNNIINELFFGINYNAFTGIIYFGFGDELSPNFLTILDCNVILPKLPFDSSIITFFSTEYGELGYDISLTFSRKINYGITYGYIISNERGIVQDSVTKIYNDKNGNSKTTTFIENSVEKNLHNTIYIGLHF